MIQKEVLGGGKTAVVYHDMLGPLTVSQVGDLAVGIAYYDMGSKDIRVVYAHATEIFRMPLRQFIKECTAQQLASLILEAQQSHEPT